MGKTIQKIKGRRTIRTKRGKTILYLKEIVDTKSIAKNFAERWKRDAYKYARIFPVLDSRGRKAWGVYCGS